MKRTYRLDLLPIPGAEDIRLVIVTEDGQTRYDGIALPLPTELQRLCFADCRCPNCVETKRPAYWDTLRAAQGTDTWAVHWPEVGRPENLDAFAADVEVEP
jgi:hypothetical protein